MRPRRPNGGTSWQTLHISPTPTSAAASPLKATDADFTTDEDGIRHLGCPHLDRGGKPDAHELADDDYAFLTLGSMTADAACGDDSAPELSRDKHDGGWRLWEAIAARAESLTRNSPVP